MNHQLSHYVLILLLSLHCGDAQQLPPGFTAQQVAHIEDATSISHVPSTSTEGVERLLATSKNGKLFLVTIAENLSSSSGSSIDLLPNVQVQEIADFGSSVCLARELGLISAVAHPDFENGSPYVYVYYTEKDTTSRNCVGDYPRSGPRHKCARFDYDDNGQQLDRNTELVLFVTPPVIVSIHTGGSMAFGNADGLLYISVGDSGGRTLRVAQEPDNLFGTVVRLKDDGSLPESNPYAATGERCRDTGSASGGGAVCQEIFAWGLRNPFKITMDPNTNNSDQQVRFWIGEVGDNTWEEINECGSGYAGANYGYPTRDGPCSASNSNNCAAQTDFQDPVYWYAHPSQGGCVIGSAISKTALWPQTYDQVFFGDYLTGEIYMITPDANNECRDCSQPRPAYQRTTFQTEAPSIVDLRFVPFRNNNQALYYLMRVGNSSLRRIVYTGGGNISPVAVIQTSVSAAGTVPSGTAIVFDGTGSYDGNGDSLTYQWDFGDGQSSAADVATHTYSQDGRYIVSLVVSDGQLESLSVSEEIQVGVPPAVEIVNPQADEVFAVGDIFTLTGQATSKGLALDGSSMKWEVRQVHGDHFHPFLSPQTGNNIVLSPAFEPEDFLASTNSFLRILLTATDFDGLETTVTRDVLPIQHTIDFRTEPPGLSIEADGFVLTTPTSGVSWENYQLLLSATDTARYEFEEWSTGELLAAQTTPSVTVTVTADLQTVTAVYSDRCQCTGSFFWCFFHGLLLQLPCRVSAWFQDTANPLRSIVCSIPLIGTFICPYIPL